MGTARRALAGVGVVVAALAIGGIVVAGDDPPPDGVRAVGGAGSSAVADAPARSTGTTGTTAAAPVDGWDGEDAGDGVAFGGVTDVAVHVTPREHLDDGAAVRIAVEGLEHLPAGSIALMCRGNVRTGADPVSSCDPSAVTPLEGDAEGGYGPSVTEQMHVRVGRILHLEPPYDCATGPSGCLLVLAPYDLPPRGVAVPLSFDPTAAPEPAASIVRGPPLDARGDVVLEASGFRPHSTVTVMACAGDECDRERGTFVPVSAQGRVDAVVPVDAAIYPYSGRVDCTLARCHLLVESLTGERHAVTGPLVFAPGVLAPTPRIALDPPGPYTDGQEVTLRGTGFPPGLDLGGRIGQCPAHLDTAVEERCTYGPGPVVVAADGTFTTTRTVSASLALTGACATTGCVLGWVINHGTTVAAVPIEVREPG